LRQISAVRYIAPRTVTGSHLPSLVFVAKAIDTSIIYCFDQIYGTSQMDSDRRQNEKMSAKMEERKKRRREKRH
jgi:hypothetical protein